MEKITMRRDRTLTVQEGYDRFIRVKKLANLSSETIKNYNTCFRYFAGFFNASRPCAEIVKDTIYDYLEHLQQHTNANSIILLSTTKNKRQQIVAMSNQLSAVLLQKNNTSQVVFAQTQ